jgi:hypothetical protein
VFIGHAEGVNAYRILDPMTRHVRTARDVIFDVGRDWLWSQETNNSASASPSEQLEGFGGAGDSPSIFGSPTPDPRMPSPAPTLPVAPVATPEHGASRAPIFATLLKDDEDHMNTVHNDTPLRYHTIDDILVDQAVVPGSVQRNIDIKLHLMHTREPCSLTGAEGDMVGVPRCRRRWTQSSTTIRGSSSTC